MTVLDRAVVTVIFAVVILLIACSCRPPGWAVTKVPRSDRTPPNVKMLVWVKEHEGAFFTLTPSSGDESFSISAGPTMMIQAFGEDYQGIRQLRIEGSMTISCSGKPEDRTERINYRSSVPAHPAAGVGDWVEDTLQTLIGVDTSSLTSRCGDGFTFAGASGTFRVSGENFHGGIATTSEFSLTLD